MSGPRKEYVAGFLLNGPPQDRRVLLVRKLKGPPMNIGKLNAIGGKLEPGEQPGNAMVREFHEETGIATNCLPSTEGRGITWRCYATLSDARVAVFFYKASTGHAYAKWRQTEDEPLFNLPLADVLAWSEAGRANLAYNLYWLLHMALDSEIAAARIYEDAMPATHGEVRA